MYIIYIYTYIYNNNNIYLLNHIIIIADKNGPLKKYKYKYNCTCYK